MARQWIATRPGGLEVFELVDVEVPAPGPGEVTVRVRAAGMNPADAKHVFEGRVPDDFPRPVGYEVAGVVSAIGPDTELASGGGAVGDEVLAFRVRGGWATELNIPARDVFARPRGLPFEQAATLLLAATTAAEMLHVTGVRHGETVLVHGASGAVGVMLLQQAALDGVRVVGTAGPARFDVVRGYGGEPVTYGDGLEERVRAAAPDGIDAALDCIGTDEALAVSSALVPDPSRMVSIVASAEQATAGGYRRIGGAMPASKAYRDSVRGELVELAGDGKLEVTVAATYPLDEALTAAEVLQGRHPGGKLALIP
jgi:NADPH:quinone reductase-like Zn-dependent oxidoreductase